MLDKIYEKIEWYFDNYFAEIMAILFVLGQINEYLYWMYH